MSLSVASGTGSVAPGSLVGVRLRKTSQLPLVYLDQVGHFAILSLSFVAALAWNSAFQSLFQQSGFRSSGPWAYALAVTLVAVIAAAALNRAEGK